MQYDEDKLGDSLEKVSVNLKDSDWRVRLLAVKNLEQYGHRVPLRLLVGAITDPHRSVRVAALETCEALSPFVPAALLEIGLSDSAWSVRAAAAWALGSFAARAPEPRLLALLDDPQEYGIVRASALYALSTIQGKQFNKRLLEALYDSEACVREEAAQLLGGLEEKLAIQPLMTIYQQDKEPLVRGAAVIALGQMKEQEERIKNVLSMALHDKEPYVRGAAAQALGITEGTTTTTHADFSQRENGESTESSEKDTRQS